VKGFIRRYLALTTKEVEALRRNRGLVIQLLLPPTIVLVIFGYALLAEGSCPTVENDQRTHGGAAAIEHRPLHSVENVFPA
jgi:hypothetical protein